MRIAARIRKRLGALTLDVNLDRDGSLALFGPSGAGKSTVLACLAGLSRPDEGRVEIDGRALFDSGRPLDVPAHRRGIAIAFQDHRLFPHLDVRENLTFAPGADRSGRLSAAIDALALAPLIGRMPRDLSGGERARVSIGRALLSPARLVLLDEPMAGLDAALREGAVALIREAMGSWGKTIVHVSHSPAEVAAVTDHVVAIDGGGVVGEGAPMTVLTAGAVLALWREEGFENSFAGTVEADGVAAGGEVWRTGRTDLAAGEEVMVSLRASDIILARDRPDVLSARNIFHARVTRVTGSGELALVGVDVGGVPLYVEVTAAAAQDVKLAAGAEVWVIVKATSLRVTEGSLRRRGAP